MTDFSTLSPTHENAAILNQLERQTELLERLVMAVEQRPIAAPNYDAHLRSFDVFDWGGIGAQVEETDADGVTQVRWRGHLYRRRSPDNKFPSVIWFSRSVGKDEAGNNRYERLITFKSLSDTDPLPLKVKQQAA
jgi:hypothetical protein